jgi:hypothetical protein
MSDLVIRFLVGGLVVSLFAMLSDALRPKSFAGLFGAAPSIALDDDGGGSFFPICVECQLGPKTL